MDKTEKLNIIESIKKSRPGMADFEFIDDPNEPIKLGCNSCGKCCRDREDILLKPNDLYSMAKALNKEPIDIIHYCNTYVGNNSNVPIIAIKFRPTTTGTICPFLKKVDDKTYHCRVHSGKPGVCRIYPLGRIEVKDEITYIIQDIKCVTEEEKIETTINEWTLSKENFGEEYLKAYFGLIMKLKTHISLTKLWKAAEKRNTKDIIMAKIISFLYILDSDKSLEDNLKEYVARGENELKDLICYLKKESYGVIK